MAVTEARCVQCLFVLCGVGIFRGRAGPLCMAVCSHHCAKWLRVGTSMQLCMQLSSVGPSGVALGEVCSCQDEGVMLVVLLLEVHASVGVLSL
jgi:hypothetical protein